MISKIVNTLKPQLQNKTLFAGLLSLLFFILFYLNIWNSYGYGEAGSFQLKGLLGYSNIEFLESLTHPGYIIVSSLFYQLIGDISFGGILAATTSAVALFMFYIVALKLTPDTKVVFIFTVMLGLSHAFFWLATIPEVYSLHIMLLCIEVWLFYKFWQQQNIWYLYLLTLLSGFNLGVHQLEAFNSLAIAITCLLFAKNRKLILFHSPFLILIFLLGFSPTLVLFFRDVRIETLTLKQTMEILFVGRWGDNMMSLKGVSTFNVRIRILALLGISFISPALIFAFMQTVRNFTKKTNAFNFYLSLGFVINFLFVFSYDVEDSFTFCLPTLFFMYMLAVQYFSNIKSFRSWQKILIVGFVFQPLIYISLPYLANYLELPQKNRAIPYRETYSYYLHPFKKNQSQGSYKFIDDTKQIARKVSTEDMLKDITIIADWTLNRVLKLAKVLDPEFTKVTIIPGVRFVPEKTIHRTCRQDNSKKIIVYFVKNKMDNNTKHKVNQTTAYVYDCENISKL